MPPSWTDTNYAGLVGESLGGKTKLQRVVERADKPQLAVAPGDTKPGWMRWVIAGDEITGQFHDAAKVEWQRVGKRKLPARPKFRAGITSGGVPKADKREARFSDFRILRLEK